MRIKNFVLSVIIILGFGFLEAERNSIIKDAKIEQVFDADQKKCFQMLQQKYDVEKKSNDYNKQFDVLELWIHYLLEAGNFEEAKRKIALLEEIQKEINDNNYKFRFNITKATWLFLTNNNSLAKTVLEINKFNLKTPEEIIVDNAVLFSKIFRSENLYQKAESILNNVILKVSQEPLLVDLYIESAEMQSERGLFRSALALYLKAENILMKENGKISVKAMISNDVGLMYRELGEYDNALEAFFKALEFLRKEDLDQNISDIYNNISSVYRLLNNKEEAINFLSKAQIINIKYENWKQVADNYLNLGKIYLSIPYPDAAIQYFNKSSVIYQKLGLNEELAMCSLALAETNLDSNNLKMAQTYIQQAIEYSKKINNKKLLSEIYNTLGEMNFKKNHLNEAITYYNKSLEYSVEFGQREQLKNSYLRLSQINEKLGNTAVAFDYFKYYEAMKDSLVNEFSQTKLVEMQTLYSIFEKEREIEKLNNSLTIEKINLKNQKKGFVYLFSGSLILVILLILTFNLYRQSKSLFKKVTHQKEKLETAYSDLNQAHLDLRKAQEETIELEKIRSAMAMTVTMNHEINQPLMIILGNVDLIEHMNSDNFSQKNQKYFVSIRNAVDRISKILADLRSLERITLKKYANNEDMIDLYDGKKEE